MMIKKITNGSGLELSTAEKAYLDSLSDVAAVSIIENLPQIRDYQTEALARADLAKSHRGAYGAELAVDFESRCVRAEIESRVLIIRRSIKVRDYLILALSARACG